MNKSRTILAIGAAVLVPLLYLVLYTPYGMDTTDFGYFYGYAWRILEGQMPYRDFSYIKPAFPLYWHAFWLWLTPENWQVLGGKAGFMASLLASSWFASLYLARFFDLRKLNLPLPILATGAFVFSIHSFPHMPWHTADGALFCGAALWLAAIGMPVFSGIVAACAMLCKQSFLIVPLGIIFMLAASHKGWRKPSLFLAGCLFMLAGAYLWIWLNGAWPMFRAMTTGPLDIREALDAGIFIYLRQNWLVPVAAILPWLAWRLAKKPLPGWLSPCYCYLVILASWHIFLVFSEKQWIGFGLSWPTLFMLLGGICLLAPRKFLTPWWKGQPAMLAPAAVLCAALIASWSMAISGGYKIPAFFAAPLLFSFYLIHASLGGNCRKLAWATLACGLLMFGAGYRYPYVFPVRPLEKSQLNLDAGKIYPKATGVLVDADMLARLEELQELRAKYGPMYKTLPGFSLAYYLNGDEPVYSSDWLIDWEINGDVDRLYQELVDKKLTVFMERDQLDTTRADAYDRAGYGVPQKVRKLWRIVEETPHFVVFQPPLP